MPIKKQTCQISLEDRDQTGKMCQASPYHQKPLKVPTQAGYLIQRYPAHQDESLLPTEEILPLLMASIPVGKIFIRHSN